MIEKKEIKLNKEKIKNNIKLIIISSILSFVLLLIIAVFGETMPRSTSSTDSNHTEILCYNGILSKDDYSNRNNDEYESIKFHLGYYLGDPHPTAYDPNANYKMMTRIDPLENERWTIPKTFFTSERKDSDITFIDKFLVIYVPLILSKNFLLWIIFSICIFFILKLKNKYHIKFE